LFVKDAPFSYEKNLLKKSAKDWTITEMWIYNLQLLLAALTRNEDYLATSQINPPPKFAMKTNVWVSTCKNTAAVIFYAIATKTGPHFETSNPEHRVIGGNAGKSPQYNAYEQKVAAAVFHALGVTPQFIDHFVLNQAPGPPGSTNKLQDALNKTGRFITNPKCMILHWLGMSGKPAWDGRLFKKPRPRARTVHGVYQVLDDSERGRIQNRHKVGLVEEVYKSSRGNNTARTG
jgi:hypothetical protein